MKSALLTLVALGLTITAALGQAPAKPATAKKKAAARPAAAKKRRPVTVVLTEATVEKGPARLAVGDTLVLALTENPTTGYRWAISAEPPKEKLRAAGDTYATKPANADMVGVGGTRRLRFVALAAGKAVLEVQNRREWEKDRPDRRLRVTVEIK